MPLASAQRRPKSNSYTVRLLLSLPSSDPSSRYFRTWYVPTFFLVCRELSSALDPSFSAFPTYPVVLGLKGTMIRPRLQSQLSRPTSTGTDQDVVNFTERLRDSNTIKRLPKFDPRRVVHASQSIEILKPLPLVSGPGWRLKKRLTSIRENSSYHPPRVSSCDA